MHFLQKLHHLKRIRIDCAHLYVQLERPLLLSKLRQHLLFELGADERSLGVRVLRRNDLLIPFPCVKS